MTKILIVDDQRLMCDGLKSMLEINTHFNVVGMAYNGYDAIELANKINPDLVLLDIRMPEMDGVETVLRLKKEMQHIKVVMLTTFADEDYIMNAIANGADGYLLKDMDTVELINAVENTMNGNMVMPNVVAENLKKGIIGIKDAKDAKNKLKEIGFTGREIEITQMIANGFNNSQIAMGLCLSKGTVRNYVSIIYEKLDSPDRSKAIIILKDMGL